MDELERLQKENRLLKDKIQKLEETLSIVADMNKSNEIGVYIKCQQRVVSLMRLMNETSEKTKLNVIERQEKLKRAEEEKTVLDAKILKETGISMQKIQNETNSSTDLENQFTYKDVKGGIEIVSYNGNDSAVVIPQEIKSKLVVSIGKRAFSGKVIKQVCFPETIQDIRDEAFIGCKFLESVCIPESVKHLGKYCFSLTALREITIPKNISAIPQYCFSECKQLRKAKLNEGLRRIGREAFANTKLMQITIPESVSIIEDNAFLCTGSQSKKLQITFRGKTKYSEAWLGNVIIKLS